VAFTMVLLAENARIPVDNPATHLELTMIHEALPARIFGAPPCAHGMGPPALKLFNYCLHRGCGLHNPGAFATSHAPSSLAVSIVLLGVKTIVCRGRVGAH